MADTDSTPATIDDWANTEFESIFPDKDFENVDFYQELVETAENEVNLKLICRSVLEKNDIQLQEAFAANDEAAAATLGFLPLIEHQKQVYQSGLEVLSCVESRLLVALSRYERLLLEDDS